MKEKALAGTMEEGGGNRGPEGGVGLLGRSGKKRDLLSVSEFEDKIGIYLKESCWASGSHWREV